MKIFATGWSENFDGPGLRWMIYLKGCNFECQWCASPEGMKQAPDMLFFAERAEQAEEACPHCAVTKDEDKGEWNIDRNCCISCANNFCTAVWQHPAFARVGKEMSVMELVKKACKYRPLFGKDGGVTFGGGEPTLQAQEVLLALDELKKEHIHTAIETNASSPELSDFYNQVDLLICDLKCVSQELHQKWIGADNSMVLINLKEAAKQQKDLLIRVPFITGMNDDEVEQQKIIDFLRELAKLRARLEVEVLRLHHLGEPKYRALGKEYPMRDVPPPSKEKAEQFIAKMRQYGIDANLGG
jgi:pyruvate formate lyase activating enzyme